MFVVSCLWFVVCCWMFVVGGLLVVCCLHVGWLVVVCGSLLFARCSLFVVRCL